MSWQKALLDAASSVLVEVATGRRIKVGGCLPGQALPPKADVYRASSRNLPPKVDLRPWMSAVEDQSSVNSCASNAIVGIYEYLARRAHGHSNDVSRLFVYYNARQFDDIRGDKGSTMASNIRVLQELGACTEATWPYRADLVDRRPGDEAFREASRFLLQRAQRVPVELDAMKACLASGYPFAFGLLLFRSFDGAGRSGVVPMPDRRELGRDTHGCHAMLAVGYSDREQAFVVRNSWGTRWGDRGYCYIPYGYLANPRLCADCWTIEAVQSLDFSPHRVEDTGFDVDWDEVLDETSSPYAFEALSAVRDATMLAMAVQRDGIAPASWDGELDDWEDDWGKEEGGGGKAAAFDEDDDGFEDDGAARHSPAPVVVTLGCEGLGEPAMIPLVIARLSSLPGVLGLECDTDAMIATLTIDSRVQSADGLWRAIEGDAIVKPAWIS